VGRDMPDLLVQGGTVVTSSGTLKASILIDKGKIVSISSATNLEADARIDATGLYILPGLIDTHVHFRDPGMTQKEDFLTGTRSAAKGGVTTVFDMPTTLPIVASKRQLIEKVKVIKPKAIVDFALYGGAGVGNLSELAGLAQAGAVAFKTYTVAPPVERQKEYEGTFVTDASSLYRVMEQVGAKGRILCIHAEDDNTVNFLSKQLQLQGRRDALAHSDSRPPFTEAIAVSEALTISEALHARIHLLHISTGSGVGLVRYWKKNGALATAETCPHYLLLTRDALKRHGPYAKFNPPPRDTSDNEALWRGIRDSTIDIIVSDHAPHSRQEKDAGKDDIWKAPPGTPGVETRLPLLLTQVTAGRLSLQDLVRLCSTNPARIFGLYPRKGEVAVGSDADLAIVDLRTEWTLRSDELESKAKETFLFDGWKAKGRCACAILRGKLVMKEGQIVGDPGYGHFINASSPDWEQTPPKL
jgi:allantoinase